MTTPLGLCGNGHHHGRSRSSIGCFVIIKFQCGTLLLREGELAEADVSYAKRSKKLLATSFFFLHLFTIGLGGGL